MKIKSVDKLNGSEVLAESLLTGEKEIIIPKGTVLRKDYIPLLCSLGIDLLSVEDSAECVEKPDSFINPARMETYVGVVQKIMERHIYHIGGTLREFEVIANEIVKEINGMPESAAAYLYERTPDLYEHTVMVALLSAGVARNMNLDLKKQHDIVLGCLLHDIGIRYITTEYINREWKNADPMEVFEYKKHTILGYSALDEEAWIPENVKKMVLFHHERQDGSGFPMRRKNYETECKIIQTCDFLDCKISGMECKRSSVQEALKYMEEEAGNKFDPEIMDVLVSRTVHQENPAVEKQDDENNQLLFTKTCVCSA